jgi:citrate lyase subunit beta / citryl-CoA lyase
VAVRASIERLRNDKVMYVRVNSVDSGMLRDDLEAVVVNGLEGIRVPKVDTPDSVKAVDALLGEVERSHGLPAGRIQLCLGLESARAVHFSYELCLASSRVSSLAPGLGKGGDLQTDMAYVWSEQGTETLYIRSKVVLSARAAGIPLPLDGGYGTWRAYDPAREEAALIRSAELGRQLGYRAKICFHPGQAAHINRIFVPTAAEIAESLRIIEAGPAAVGREEHEAAQTTLRWARESGLL